MATERSNVIELIFKVREGIGQQLDQVKNKLGGVAGSAKGLVASFAGLAAATIGVTSVVAAIRKTIDASTEAETVLKKFDNAFANIGATSRRTREDIIKFADDFSKKSIFDDEKILQAQTALLQFRKVSGDTFDRVRKDAIDLASATGQDLTSAMELLGRSVERPEIAIRRLRQAGILFTSSQEKMIKKLTETGQSAKAASIILDEVEKRFRGAGEAASQTLGGAVARLKTAFDNLFEVDPKPLTDAINQLVDVLNNPDVRSGLQAILIGITKIVAKTVEWAAAAGEAADNILKSSANFQAGNGFQPDAAPQQVKLNAELQKQVDILKDLKQQLDIKNKSIYRQYTDDERKDLADKIKAQTDYVNTIREQIKIQEQADANRAKGKNFQAGLDKAADSTILDIIAPKKDTSSLEDQINALQEVTVKVYKKMQSATDDFYDNLEEQTQTSVDKEVAAYQKFQAAFDELYQHRLQLNDQELEYGAITYEQYLKRKLELTEEYNRRSKEAFDDGLAEVKVTVTKVAIPAIQTAFDKLIDVTSTALDRMLNNGRFTWRELGQYLLREILSGSIKNALTALSAAIKKAFKDGTSGGGGWGGILQNFIDALTGTSSSGGAAGKTGAGGDLPSDLGSFGNAAGGLKTRGGWVGENGPEWAEPTGSMKIYNGSMLQNLLGHAGGNTTYAPQTSIILQGNTDDKAVEQIKNYVDKKNNDTQKLILTMLGRKGLKRPT